MRCRMFLLVLLTGTLSANGARAFTVEEGTSPVGFGATWLEAPSLGKPARIRFSMAGQYAGEGIARLHIPSGVRLVQGDTLHRGLGQGSTKHWILTVTPERAGTFEIRGYLTVSEPGIGVHELDLSLPFRLDQEGVKTEASKLTRLETVRNGQRYRYGGKYLVPISRPESVTQVDIEQFGTKAKVVTSSSALCPSCGASSRVSYVVLLNERGIVTDLRPRSTTQSVAEELDAAVRSSIKTWKFEPSRVKGSPVADWLVVEIPVEVR